MREVVAQREGERRERDRQGEHPGTRHGLVAPECPQREPGAKQDRGGNQDLVEPYQIFSVSAARMKIAAKGSGTIARIRIVHFSNLRCMK